MRTTLRLALLLIAALVAASPVFAQDTDTENSIVGGTIPQLCQLRIAGTTANLLNLNQDGDGEAAYDAGFINSAATATVLTVDANTAWDLTVNYAGTGWAAAASAARRACQHRLRGQLSDWRSRRRADASRERPPLPKIPSP
jgi:hypothetical protein